VIKDLEEREIGNAKAVHHYHADPEKLLCPWRFQLFRRMRVSALAAVQKGAMYGFHRL
jgi:hypothetical protein